MNKSAMKAVMNRIGRHCTLAAAVAAAVALSGCGNMNMSRITNPWAGPQEMARLPADAVTYTCGNGKPLYVRYGPSSQYAMVIYPDQECRLDADKSGAGKFSNGRTTLTVSSAEASIEEGGATVYGGCKPVGKAS